MTLIELRRKLTFEPKSIVFSEVIALVGSMYHYKPATFANGMGEGKAINEAGSNEGSCKIFSFAMEQGFTEQDTLYLFGEYYTRDVLENPEGTDHVNIRNFMEFGWSAIKFEAKALSLRNV